MRSRIFDSISSSDKSTLCMSNLMIWILYDAKARITDNMKKMTSTQKGEPKKENKKNHA